MSEYKAIALDMDGTLLTRDHKISSATRAALAQARAHGIKVLLVTGRHYMTARPFHHELALDTPSSAAMAPISMIRCRTGSSAATRWRPPRLPSCWPRSRHSRWAPCST